MDLPQRSEHIAETGRESVAAVPLVPVGVAAQRIAVGISVLEAEVAVRPSQPPIETQIDVPVEERLQSEARVRAEIRAAVGRSRVGSAHAGGDEAAHGAAADVEVGIELEDVQLELTDRPE